MSYINTTTSTDNGVLATNKVLRNTYMLLSATLIFSAISAGISMALNMPYPGLIISLVGMLGLLFLVHKFANSALGLLFVFLFTGFMGAISGPILSMYINNLSNGPQLVMTALGGTGVIFLSLSAYVLTTKKDFSFMGGFLMAGFVVVFIAIIANWFLQLSALQLVISSAIILLMSGFILWDTSNIVQGGETNYIRATVSLYISIYNIFFSLLHLLGIFGGDD
ncbi:MAG: BAX inhibitor (BI)-1/YccA family protein [Gammaproteobacteria bacterium]|nr:MAG: BAX inhibitor (BI)-1/YccA family protein [Gammaproteobacteria bacterium]